MTDQKLKPFTVITTPKIKDSRGVYVKRGDTAYLNQAHATGYHKQGVIKIEMGDLYADDTGLGEPDKTEASEESTYDAGTDTSEDGSGDGADRPRKRVSRRMSS